MSSSKKKGMPAVHGSEVNVTPLIDVIMCLIIFFMLVAKIGVSTGSNAKVNLPYTYLGKKIDDMGNTLTLNLLGVGVDPNAPTGMQVTALVDGQEKDLPFEPVKVAGDKPTSPLQETVRQMKVKFKDQFKVILRTDKELPYSQVQQVLAICAVVGADKLEFATKQGKDPDQK
jgi:biopolymer transport protein ExbD